MESVLTEDGGLLDVVGKLEYRHLPKTSYGDRSVLPDVPGIYFVVLDGDVYYVGMSCTSLLRRWNGHHLTWFCKTFEPSIYYLVMPLAQELVPDLERFYIQKYNPCLNGRTTKEEIERVMQKASAVKNAQRSKSLLNQFARDQYDQKYLQETGGIVIKLPPVIGAKTDLVSVDELSAKMDISPLFIRKAQSILSSSLGHRFKTKKSKERFFTCDEANLIYWYHACIDEGVEEMDIHRYLSFKASGCL